MKGLLRTGWLVFAGDVAFLLWSIQRYDERHLSAWHVRLDEVAYYGGALLFVVLIVLSISWSRVQARDRLANTQ
jgi:hypothetical protein